MSRNRRVRELRVSHRAARSPSGGRVGRGRSADRQGQLSGRWLRRRAAGGTTSSPMVPTDQRTSQALQGNPEKWDQWPEIRRINRLASISGDFRKKLLEERDAACVDSRLKARFMSYRLNLPSGDESEMLLSRSLLTVRCWPLPCLLLQRVLGAPSFIFPRWSFPGR